MKIKLYIIFAPFLLINFIYAQSFNVEYEQKALDFMYDSLITKKQSVSFTGYTDSTITLFTNSCFINFPIEDKILNDYYKKESDLLLNSGFSNNYDFLYNASEIKKVNYKGKIKNKILFLKNKRSITVFQKIKVGDFIYVLIRFKKNKKTFTDYFFKLNNSGKILTHCTKEH